MSEKDFMCRECFKRYTGDEAEKLDYTCSCGGDIERPSKYDGYPDR